MRFAAFSCRRKALSVEETDFKSVAKWRYDWCMNDREIAGRRTGQPAGSSAGSSDVWRKFHKQEGWLPPTKRASAAKIN